MKINLHQYAMDWVAAAGRGLDGITTDEVLAEVNANLMQYDDDTGEEVEREPITRDEAETIRTIVADALRAAGAGRREKQMTKHEYAKRHGLTLRRVTLEDKFYAHTDYQHGARYIIQGGDDEEWFSARGSLSDMIDYVNAHLTAAR